MSEPIFKITRLDKDAPDYGRGIGLSNTRIKELMKSLDELKLKHVMTGTYNSLDILIEAVNTIPRSTEELVFLSLSYGYNAAEMEFNNPQVRRFVEAKKKEIQNGLNQQGT